MNLFDIYENDLNQPTGPNGIAPSNANLNDGFFPFMGHVMHEVQLEATVMHALQMRKASMQSSVPVYFHTIAMGNEHPHIKWHYGDVSSGLAPDPYQDLWDIGYHTQVGPNDSTPLALGPVMPNGSFNDDAYEKTFIARALANSSMQFEITAPPNV